LWGIPQRLEKLPQLGAEPAQFAKLLRPVLVEFVKSFDNPGPEGVQNPWLKIAHKSGGNSLHYLSDWITAFYFGDEEGDSLYCYRAE